MLYIRALHTRTADGVDMGFQNGVARVEIRHFWGNQGSRKFMESRAGHAGPELAQGGGIAPGTASPQSCGCMAEEPIALHRAEARPAARNPSWGGSVWTAAKVCFDRAELHRILTLYGRMVAAGQWRDYAMDFLDDRAVFSAYRRTSEVPVYTIVKQPRLRARQGQYSLVAATGLVLKRGHELDQVLRVLEKKLIKVLAD